MTKSMQLHVFATDTEHNTTAYTSASPCIFDQDLATKLHFITSIFPGKNSKCQVNKSMTTGAVHLNGSTDLVSVHHVACATQGQ